MEVESWGRGLKGLKGVTLRIMFCFNIARASRRLKGRDALDKTFYEEVECSERWKRDLGDDELSSRDVISLEGLDGDRRQGC